MRPAMLSLWLIVATLLPKVGTAQVAYRPTPVPQVTAANAIWQINGEPIFFGGSFYYPTGPTVFFDGQLMARVGEYLTVPLYADATQEAFSRVFVPVAGGMMKPYDRRRAESLPGTVGSVFPAVADDRPVGTSGSAATPRLATPAIERTTVYSVPRPTTNTGISVVFEGTRWVSAGTAVSFSPDRFIPIGDYHGFPVYREKQGSADTIYVTVVADGPLAPYKRY